MIILNDWSIERQDDAHQSRGAECIQKLYISGREIDKNEALNTGKYGYTVYGYIYEPELGEPDAGIKPGAPFTEIPYRGILYHRALG